MKKLKVMDLFAGCGGLVDGFEQTGLFTTVACVEWESSPCTTLIKRLHDKWNYSDAARRVLRFDMRRSKELLEGWENDSTYGSGCGLAKLVSEAKGIDMIIGGPPCQAYSIAGRIRDEYGMHYDYRNYLFESYLDVVKYFRPPIVVFENVPGMLSAKPGNISIVDRITSSFNEAGYELISSLKEKALLDFVSFGVPQNRSRVILVGLKRTVFKDETQRLLSFFYEHVLPQYKTSQVSTVCAAIGDLPSFFPVKSEYTVGARSFSHKPENAQILNHIPRYHNRRDIQIFRKLAADIETGASRYADIKMLHKLYTEKTGKVSNVHKYYVLRWGEPSNTIPAHLRKDGLRHIHPDSKQARSITVREAARLQTFKDDFEFLGSMGDQYKMVGNAVPPLFASILGDALYQFTNHLFDRKGEKYVGSANLCKETVSSGARV